MSQNFATSHEVITDETDEEEAEEAEDFDDGQDRQGAAARFVRATYGNRVKKVSLPSQFPSNRYFFRRRSISLTSEGDLEAMASFKTSGGQGSGQQLSPTSTASGRSSRRDQVDHQDASSGARDRDATPLANERLRKKYSRSSTAISASRPSSIMVYDQSEEFDKLANDIIASVKNLQAADETTLKRPPKPVPPVQAAASTVAAAAVVRRNSSGYSTGSASSVKSSINEAAKGRKSSTHQDQRRPSSTIMPPTYPASKEAAKSKLSLAGLIKRSSNLSTSSSTSSPVQSRIAAKKALDRQISKDSEAKKAQFTQTRSHTGLNLFGGRRRSIAITDDAYNAAIRSAKSHLDLSDGQNQPEVAAASAAGGQFNGLNKKSSFSKKSSEVTKDAAAPRQRRHFNERPWIELEKLWRGRAKDPSPDIEALLVSCGGGHRGAGDRDRRSNRSQTIPNNLASIPTKISVTRTPSAQSSHSKGYWPPPASPSPTASMSKVIAAQVAPNIGKRMSPQMAKKAVDLIAPHVLDSWLVKHGHQQPQTNRSSDCLTRSGGHPGDDQDHFSDLVKSW